LLRPRAREIASCIAAPPQPGLLKSFNRILSDSFTVIKVSNEWTVVVTLWNHQTWRERTSINNALKFASSSDPVLDHLRYCLQHADYLSHLWFELIRLPTLNLILSTHQFLKILVFIQMEKR
jgi:hypothetical protein